jgi:hypothetical protein
VARYLVSYDLIRPGQAYQRLIEHLRALRGIRVLESTWLVKSMSAAKTFRDELFVKGGLDANDRLLVTTVSAPAAWKGKLQTKDEEVLRFYQSP